MNTVDIFFIGDNRYSERNIKKVEFDLSKKPTKEFFEKVIPKNCCLIKFQIEDKCCGTFYVSPVSTTTKNSLEKQVKKEHLIDKMIKCIEQIQFYHLYSQKEVLKIFEFLCEKKLVNFYFVDLENDYDSNKIVKNCNLKTAEDVLNALDYVDIYNKYLVYNGNSIYTTDDLSTSSVYNHILNTLIEIENKEEYKTEKD